MKIIVAPKVGASTTEKGDLLEDLAGKVLSAQSYYVVKKVQKSGLEIDLECKHKANQSKTLFVECKAYAPDNNLEADTIKLLVSTRELEGYSEAWIMTTSGFSKGANGIIDKIEARADAKCYMFLGPERLVEIMVDSHTIVDHEVARREIIRSVNDEQCVGEETLLISDYGNFWAFDFVKSGEKEGIFFAYANTGKPVEDEALLIKIAELDSQFLKSDTLSLLKCGGKLSSEAVKPGVGLFKLNATYRQHISDLNIKFDHPEKANLTLEDIFIFPDIEDATEKDHPRKRSDTLTALGDRRHFMVFGEDLSGKTSLARMLQLAFSNERITLLLDAKDIKNSDFNKFGRLVVDCFKRQYSDEPVVLGAFNDLLATDPKRIAIIVDDFDCLGIRRTDAQVAFLRALKENFDTIVLLANKTIELQIMAKGTTKEMLDTFEIYRILPLGHSRRDELIEKWVTIADGETLTDADVLNKKIEISSKINVAVGANFIPTYPFYLLTMLHLFESGRKSSLQGSSYAELYGFLVNYALLNSGVKSEDLDFYHTYLSYIANHLFQNGQREISDDNLGSLFQQYSEQMDLEKPFDQVHRTLEQAKILRLDDGQYAFCLNYCQYFFTAKYLSDNIENQEIRATIQRLISELHKTDSAHVVVFLIHHSKNKWVIESILHQAREVFAGSPMSTLSSEELKEVNGLIQEQVDLSFKDGDPSERRKRALATQDDIEGSDKEPIKDEDQAELDLFGRADLAFKIIEVLGQIVNNYYGSLDAESKAVIIDELQSLGLRSLQVFLRGFDEYVESIRQDFLKEAGERALKTESEKQQLANKIVYTFSELIIYVFIKRISDSMASKNLFLTLKKVTDERKTIASRLINIAAKLSLPNQLSANNTSITALYQELEMNHLTKDVIRLLVMNHMYKFDVDIKEKQRICDKLNIDFVQSQQKVLRQRNQ